LKPHVTVVDYGMGNLLSVMKALQKCGAEVTLESSPLFIGKAERLLLPGVGAFADGMSELHSRGLVEPIRQYAASGRPLLGICLGMQMLLEGSDEFGASSGLGIVPGWVRKLPDQDGIKLPHIGWSGTVPPEGGRWEASLLDGTAPGQEFYFVHSFGAAPADPGDCLAETAYGEARFCSAVRRGSVSGFQFHPEKSGEAGLAIVRRFLGLH
jgi:glutamine amidotransferase